MSGRVVSGLVLLAGCPHALDEEDPCQQAAFAVAARAEQCTGDAALGHALYETLASAECTVDALDNPMDEGPHPDAYHCALVARNLACELAVVYGDDAAAWLDSSPTCAAILELP